MGCKWILPPPPPPLPPNAPPLKKRIIKANWNLPISKIFNSLSKSQNFAPAPPTKSYTFLTPIQLDAKNRKKMNVVRKGIIQHNYR